MYAYPWGSATHAYLMKAIKGEEVKHLELYGAMAPDLFNLLLESSDYDYLIKQTHRHYRKVVIKSLKTDLRRFAFGFASHNEIRGADYTAHRNGRTTPKGYVIGKSDSLATQLIPQLEVVLENAGISYPHVWAGLLASEIAHPLIETAIDLLIKRNEDPSIGAEIFQAVTERPSSVADLLASAYAKGISKQMGISYEEASEFIRKAESDFQQLMIRYGEILSKEESEAIGELATQGVFLMEGYLSSITNQEIDIPPQVMVEFLYLAIHEVENDYAVEITQTIDFLRRTLKILDRKLGLGWEK